MRDGCMGRALSRAVDRVALSVQCCGCHTEKEPPTEASHGVKGTSNAAAPHIDNEVATNGKLDSSALKPSEASFQRKAEEKLRSNSDIVDMLTIKAKHAPMKDPENDIDVEFIPQTLQLEPLDEFSAVTSEGNPFPVVQYGPPRPPCYAQRVATVHTMEVLDLPPEPNVEPVLELACTVFSVGIAMMSFLDSECVFVRNATPPGEPGCRPPAGLCGWSLVPDGHEYLIVHDTLRDARMRDNPWVKGGPKLRFYCGAPLLSSNGHRIGTLCIVDASPRAFDSAQCGIMGNMAELIVREVEAAWAQVVQRRHGDKLLRAIDCYTEGFLFVDTQGPRWTVLHCNASAIAVSGVPRDALLGKGFCDMFTLPGDNKESWEEYRQAAAKGLPFTIGGMAVMGWGGPDLQLDMIFRLATLDPLDGSAQLIGVPAYVEQGDEDAAAHRYYFVNLKRTQAAPADNRASATGAPAGPAEAHALVAAHPVPRWSPVPGLELGALVGAGPRSRVYRARRAGAPLAVKIVPACDIPEGSAILRGLEHPAVVRTLGHTMVDVASHPEALGCVEPRAAGPPQDAIAAWLLLEFCDQGSLQMAVDRGAFRDVPSNVAGQPALAAILATAVELSAGLAFLHAQGVVHGSLTGGNILLTSSPTAPHGFSAKVADYGLARDTNVLAQAETRSYGKISHMPPELLRRDVVCKAGDVYAFGVLLWQMYTGSLAWAAMSYAQVIKAVAIDGKRLRFPASTPHGFASLAQRCMAYAPDERPSFAAVHAELEALRRTL